MRKRQLICAVAILTLLGIPTLVLSLEQPPEYNCQMGDLLPLDPTTYKAHPIKLVVKPWRGPHHVYGIFMIPEDYKPNREAVLDVKGVSTYNKTIYSRGQETEGIQAKPGYYLAKVFIKTRTTLKLSAKGSFNQLRQPCNWTLTYSKQS